VPCSASPGCPHTGIAPEHVIAAECRDDLVGPHRRPARPFLECRVWCSWYRQANFNWQVVIAMSPFLSSKENIVVNLIYEWLGESRINRTYDEYMEIASRFPKLTACHAYVNQRLREMADAENAPFDGICYFKAGDRYPWYKDFPTSLSMETVRTALLKMGHRTAGRSR
jgi:hypothetical protein